MIEKRGRGIIAFTPYVGWDLVLNFTINTWLAAKGYPFKNHIRCLTKVCKDL